MTNFETAQILTESYNLADDPKELVNLVEQLAYAALVAEFWQEVTERWDVAALHATVVASQRQRHLVSQALLQGKQTYWHFQPRRDAGQEDVRNHMEFWEL